MVFDFSKLSQTQQMSKEEKVEWDKRLNVAEQQKAINIKFSKAVITKKFSLIEDSDIRFNNTGDPVAILRGKDFTALSEPLIHEDSHDFIDRYSKLKKGDEVMAHGHMENRSWKDRDNNWQSKDEFIMDAPISPAFIGNKLLEGVKKPVTVVALRQQQLSQQQMQR